MSFDPATFEAEVALKLIPTERFPAAAQDALEAGFEGPCVVRIAILDPRYGWAIEQALPAMLAEIGCSVIAPKEAAIRLACLRAQSILASGEDPLPTLPYFYRLMVVADYPEELVELGYLSDEWEYFTQDPCDEERAWAIDALEGLLSPESREERRAKKLAALVRRQEEIKRDWPYVLNSPMGRAMLKDRCEAHLVDMRPAFVIELIPCVLLGWAFSSWRLAVFGYLALVPLLLVLTLLGQYLQLKRERRNLLLRYGVPDDQI